MLVAALALAALVAAVAVSTNRKRQVSEAFVMKACIGNLIALDGAKLQWAMEAGARDGDTPVELGVLKYLKGSTMPWCPASSKPAAYTLGRIGESPKCSIHGTRRDPNLPGGKKIFRLGSERTTPSTVP